jgi:hypothetical protein
MRITTIVLAISVPLDDQVKPLRIEPFIIWSFDVNLCMSGFGILSSPEWYGLTLKSEGTK